MFFFNLMGIIQILWIFVKNLGTPWKFIKCHNILIRIIKMDKKIRNAIEKRKMI